MGTTSQLLSVRFVNGASVKLAEQGRTAEGRMAGGQEPGVSTTEMYFPCFPSKIFIVLTIWLLTRQWQYFQKPS